MNRLRLWILGTALGSFAAGMNLGLVAPMLFAAEDPQGAALDDAYAADIVADYGLSRAQAASLRMVLQTGREEEIAAFRTADIAMLPQPIQNQILRARSRVERRILVILDADQRARYERDTKPPNAK